MAWLRSVVTLAGTHRAYVTPRPGFVATDEELVFLERARTESERRLVDRALSLVDEGRASAQLAKRELDALREVLRRLQDTW